jgi:shikimate kinase
MTFRVVGKRKVGKLLAEMILLSKNDRDMKIRDEINPFRC